MTKPLVVRYAAALFWQRGKGSEAQKQERAQQLQQLIKGAGFKPPKQMLKFIAKWGRRLLPAGEVESRAGHSGRKPRLSAEDCRVCHEQARGWFSQGRDGPYESGKQLVNENPVVAEVVRRADVKPRTLVDSIKRIFPRFKFAKLASKKPLSEHNRQDRLATCKKYQHLDPEVLDKVVWIDQKTLHFNRKARYGWIDSGDMDYYYDTIKRPTYKSKRLVIKYYIAVNALLGPVALITYTGTSGLPAKRDGWHFKVSSCNQQFGVVACYHMLHSLPQCNSPFGGMACCNISTLLNTQPQDSEPCSYCCFSHRSI